MRRFWLFLLLMGVLQACEYFQSKEEKTRQLVNDELLGINWNDVDQYPLFDNCDETSEKPAQLRCFQEEMMRHMVDTLQGLEYQVSQDLNDTIKVDLLIDEHGFIRVTNIQDNHRVQETLPNFNEEVTRRLNDLTTVAPALKRGMPVSMKFRLPIVLNTEN